MQPVGALAKGVHGQRMKALGLQGSRFGPMLCIAKLKGWCFQPCSPFLFTAGFQFFTRPPFPESP